MRKSIGVTVANVWIGPSWELQTDDQEVIARACGPADDFVLWMACHHALWVKVRACNG